MVGLGVKVQHFPLTFWPSLQLSHYRVSVIHDCNCFNTVKDTDFKFDKHVPNDSLDNTLKIFRKVAKGHG